MSIIRTFRQDPGARRKASQLLHAVQERGMSRERVRAAIWFADSVHQARRCKYGEALITHPLLVATLVTDLGGSEEDVIAALLHDIRETNPDLTLFSIFFAWGRPVAQRVEVLTTSQLYLPEFRMFDLHGRLLQAVADIGPGVAAIKVADRCHSSATSQSLPEHERQRLRLENQRFFAPLAHQIGARGLGQFLNAEPRDWWHAADDFPASMRALQPSFLS